MFYYFRMFCSLGSIPKLRSQLPPATNTLARGLARQLIRCRRRHRVGHDVGHREDGSLVDVPMQRQIVAEPVRLGRAEAAEPVVTAGPQDLDEPLRVTRLLGRDLDDRGNKRHGSLRPRQ